MRLQILSDLHLETEVFEPQPAPGAEALVLAGDIDSRWEALERFKGWPVPVLFVPGNHEYDRRDVDEAREALRERVLSLGLHWLDRETLLLTDAQGLRVRFVGCTRWSDFDVFGPLRRERAIKSAHYFVKVMQAQRRGAVFDAAAVRELALEDKDWLARTLMAPRVQGAEAWDATVVVTHYAPSLASADPRYGEQWGTSSFCNDDEELLPHADLWIHGHLHCRSDYTLRGTRVVCRARGHGHKGEHEGYDAEGQIEVIRRANAPVPQENSR